MPYRKTWACVDRRLIIENLNWYAKKTGKQVLAIVKAQAYGHGAVSVAQVLEQVSACAGYGVSSLDEAMELRAAGIRKPILVLGYVDPEQAPIAASMSITLTIVSLMHLKAIGHVPGLHVHLKIDTGMNRLGLRDASELSEALSLCAQQEIVAQGIFTHFYDATDAQRRTAQYERFAALVDAHPGVFQHVHCAASDAAVLLADPRSDLVRIGIGLYGYSELPEMRAILKPALSLYAHVSHLHQAQVGETVSYGGLYQLSETQTIATVPIGYADGFLRANRGSNVYVNGQAYPIAGNICMDQLMFVADDTVKVGSLVEIIGPHRDARMVANCCQTIANEILTGISARVVRVYEDDPLFDH